MSPALSMLLLLTCLTNNSVSLENLKKKMHLQALFSLVFYHPNELTSVGSSQPSGDEKAIRSIVSADCYPNSNDSGQKIPLFKCQHSFPSTVMQEITIHFSDLSFLIPSSKIRIHLLNR